MRYARKKTSMKTVFFVRHAKSSWKDPSLKDIERPLNKRGLRDAPFMSKLLAGRANPPDKIISSPAKRALVTARYFVEAFGLDESALQTEPLIYDGDQQDILSFVSGLPSEWSTVMIFGHNPVFTTIANHFSDEYIANVPTCGIVKVVTPADNWNDFDGKQARMETFYYPKQYFT